MESSETVKEENEVRIWVIMGGDTYIDTKWQVQRKESCMWAVLKQKTYERKCETHGKLNNSLCDVGKYVKFKW
jgi:hypothetical protein